MGQGMAEQTRFAENVYVAFQGGGARGIAHVGALKALYELMSNGKEQSEVRPRPSGVAGTSAGAIIAALVAADYTADQIFNSETGDHLLKHIGLPSKSLTSLFTRRGWFQIWLLRWLANLWKKAPNCMGLGLLLLVGAAVIGVLLLPFLVQLGVVVAIAILLYLAQRHVLDGLAKLTEVERIVDLAISRSPIFQGDSRSGTTFLDLAKAGGVPLTIIATNLSKKSVQVFSADHTPEVPIAKAVCASVCLPIVFGSFKFDVEGVEQYFVDGGVLSNLPIWSFDEARALDTKAWTVGFSLRTPPSTAARSGRPPLLSTLIDAVVSGPPEIHMREVASLMVVSLTPDLELLDFDRSFDKFAEVIKAARLEAAEQMIASAAEPMINFKLKRMLRVLNSELGLDELASEFKISVAMKKRRGAQTLWPRFLAGYAPQDVLERRRPISLAKSGILVDRLQAHIPVKSNNESTLTSGVFACEPLWALTYPFQDQDHEDLAIIILESATLTIDRLCDTMQVASKEAALGQLARVLADECAKKAKDGSTLKSLCLGAQLWP